MLEEILKKTGTQQKRVIGKKNTPQEHPPKNGFEVVGVHDFTISIVVDLRETGSKNVLKV